VLEISIVVSSVPPQNTRDVESKPEPETVIDTAAEPAWAEEGAAIEIAGISWAVGGWLGGPLGVAAGKDTPPHPIDAVMTNEASRRQAILIVPPPGRTS